MQVRLGGLLESVETAAKASGVTADEWIRQVIGMALEPDVLTPTPCPCYDCTRERLRQSQSADPAPPDHGGLIG